MKHTFFCSKLDQCVISAARVPVIYCTGLSFCFILSRFDTDHNLGQGLLEGSFKFILRSAFDLLWDFPNHSILYHFRIVS